MRSATAKNSCSPSWGSCVSPGVTRVSFLLDEPDTHLNPAWKWNYLQLVREVAQSNSESHVVMASHDPLTMGGLKASQVQLMAYREDGNLAVGPPSVEPRGLGFTSILTQIFGLPTTVDPETQKLLDERNALLRTDPRTDRAGLQACRPVIRAQALRVSRGGPGTRIRSLPASLRSAKAGGENYLHP